MRKLEDIKDRCLIEAQFVLSQKCSIRECAKVFKISKSTVHLDLSKRLIKIDYLLYEKIKIILEKNFQNKHIKGGEKTRKKYLKLNQKKERLK